MTRPVVKHTLTDDSTFYCFSPFVMLSTCTIEILMAVYVAMLYGLKKPIARVVFTMLLLLAGFQLAEYLLCQTSDQGTINFIARVGFSIVTLLPPFGIFLSSVLVHRRKIPWYVPASFVTAGLWIAYFLAFEGSVVRGVCGANYAILDLHERVQFLYGAYYWGLLTIGVWEAHTLSRRKMFRKYSRALQWLVAGHLVFMVPMMLSIVMFPETYRAIPSIMCGFAIALAWVLTFRILPESMRE